MFFFITIFIGSVTGWGLIIFGLNVTSNKGFSPQSGHTYLGTKYFLANDSIVKRSLCSGWSPQKLGRLASFSSKYGG